MGEIIDSLISEIEMKPEMQWPAPIMALMLRMAVNLDRKPTVEVKELVYATPLSSPVKPPSDVETRPVAHIDPTDRLDIDRLLSIEGETPNSELSERGLLERFAGVVRLLSRVLAMKHCSVDQAATMGHIITKTIELANLAKNAAYGELDLNTLEIVRPVSIPQMTTDPPVKKPRKKPVWTDEQRAAQAERMRRLMDKRYGRTEGGGNPSSTFPRPAADASAAFVGIVDGNTADARTGP